jgi:hypothetical protein
MTPLLFQVSGPKTKIRLSQLTNTHPEAMTNITGLEQQSAVRDRPFRPAHRFEIRNKYHKTRR